VCGEYDETLMAAGDSLTVVHSELSIVPEWLNHNACY